MPSYEFLCSLPPEAYLNPDNFKTEFDHLPDTRGQYKKGLSIGLAAKQVSIGAGGTWNADMLDGSMMTSHEGIGYHAHTAELLNGFLDSGVEIAIYRTGVAKPTIITMSVAKNHTFQYGCKKPVGNGTGTSHFVFTPEQIKTLLLKDIKAFHGDMSKGEAVVSITLTAEGARVEIKEGVTH